MEMKNVRRVKPAEPATPDLHWINRMSEMALRPYQIQSLLWRETLTALAAMAELRADCLRKLAGVSTPMDAIAIQNEYMQKLLQSTEEEGNRIALALKSAVVTQPEKVDS